jgi:hypothetical protein
MEVADRVFPVPRVNVAAVARVAAVTVANRFVAVVKVTAEVTTAERDRPVRLLRVVVEVVEALNDLAAERLRVAVEATAAASVEANACSAVPPEIA